MGRMDRFNRKGGFMSIVKCERCEDNIDMDIDVFELRDNLEDGFGFLVFCEYCMYKPMRRKNEHS